MSTAEALRVERLAVRHRGGREPRPREVTFRLAPMERLAVLGPSGCGKSTLLAALAGIIPEVVDADVAGELRIGGHHTAGQPIHRIAERAGFLSQHPLDQVVLARVEDEVAFGLESAAVPREEIGPRVTAALASTGCRPLAERHTATLSGGELQRVALSAVLARRPEVLLLDEPTAMLDPVARGEMHRLLEDRRCAVLLVEHDLDALDLGRWRLLVLDERGAPLATGAAREVLAAYAEPIGAAGCWLPVGVRAALACGRVPSVADVDDPTDALQALAAALPPPRPRTGAPGRVVLTASGAQFRAGGSRRAPVVVRSATLEVRSGTVTALLGRNGSGKTSTLLGLAGLLPRCGGSTRVDGRLGMVFQHPEHQFLRRSVAEEVRFGTELSDAAVAALLDELDLTPLADQDPFRLSGGQQRRLSIAAALAHRPDVLLLDEPTFGQDAANARSIGRLLRSLADRSVAVVMVTHDVRLVARVADLVSVVQDGVVSPARAASEVLRDPATGTRAGLRLPAEVDWWSRQPRSVGLRDLLTALDVQRAPR